MTENNHLINTTDELQKYLRINISVLRDSFLPYEYDARHKYILRYIPEELHQELLDLVNHQTYPKWASTNALKAMFGQLLHHTNNALAKFTIYLAAPHLDLHLSEMGFVVSHTSNSAPASAQRVQNAVEAYLSYGYDNIETLLRFLEHHHKKIPSYKDSEHYVLENHNLIHSAAEFDNILSIGQSRLRFLELKPEMQTVKNLVIISSVGEVFFDYLVTKKSAHELDAKHAHIVGLLQKALAYITISNHLTEENAPRILSPLAKESRDKRLSLATAHNAKERFHKYGTAFLSQAKNTLLKSPADYPVYKSSSQYNKDLNREHYDNSSSRVFVFGHPHML